MTRIVPLHAFQFKIRVTALGRTRFEPFASSSCEINSRKSLRFIAVSNRVGTQLTKSVTIVYQSIKKREMRVKDTFISRGIFPFEAPTLQLRAVCLSRANFMRGQNPLLKLFQNTLRACTGITNSGFQSL